MDDCRFDNWARIVDRRTAVGGFAGGLAALLALGKAQLGIAQEDDVEIDANCRVNGRQCRRNRQCCSNKCRKRGQNNADCCSRRCRSGKCRCVPRNDRCNDNRACCSGNCGRDGFCR